MSAGNIFVRDADKRIAELETALQRLIVATKGYSVPPREVIVAEKVLGVNFTQKEK